MKASSLILSASVVLNVALLGTIAVGLAESPSPADAPKSAAAVAAPETPSGPGVETWGTLGMDADPAAVRDRLRAEGFPGTLVRAILSAQISAKYAAQRKAIEGAEELPYWKARQPDPKISAALRELARAERKEMRDLLGPDPYNFAAENYKRQIPSLATEKAEELASIAARYSDKRQDLYSSGTFDGPKLAELDKAMHAEFAAVLTPQEMEDFDLRMSRTAQQLQNGLTAFNPTEAEYRALYKLQAAFDAQYSPLYGAVQGEDARTRMQARNQLQEDIKATLGPDRYADYERATDYNYRQAAQLVARLNMPPETANDLYAIQKEYTQKQRDVMQSMQRTRPANREEAQQRMQAMQEQFTALQQEATARISTVFGNNADALDAYKTYGGQWIKNLAPRMTSSVGGTRTTIIRGGP
jgi:hypothetical protein